MEATSMNRTEKKLKEALFFLDKFEEHYRDSPEVGYYLSAYITAARSVAWVMRSEYQSVKGWEAWFASKIPESNEQEFLKKMNNLRIRTEKVGPIDLHYMFSFHIPEEKLGEEIKDLIEKNQGRDVTCTLRVIDEDNTDKIETIVGENYFQTRIETFDTYIALDEFLDEDILDICRRYYSMIEQLVIECKKQFGT